MRARSLATPTLWRITPIELRASRARESTERQYALVHRAVALGWHREEVTIIDEDLGLSGAGIAKRAGFTRLAANVALAKVGIVWGSRSRDSCATTPTGIASSNSAA